MEKEPKAERGRKVMIIPEVVGKKVRAYEMREVEGAAVRSCHTGSGP